MNPQIYCDEETEKNYRWPGLTGPNLTNIIAARAAGRGTAAWRPWPWLGVADRLPVTSESDSESQIGNLKGQASY